MSNLFRFALVLLPVTACMSAAGDDGSDTDVDDAISDAGKTDQVQALKHYVLFMRDSATYVVRANGGAMRCEDNTLAEQCKIDFIGLVGPGGIGGSREAMIDELNDHPLLVSGHLAKVTADPTIYLRASSVTPALTSVVPPVGPDHPDTTIPASCYQLRQQADASIKYTRVDGTKMTLASVTEFDAVDPTPDDWGQPTPAVQAQIDKALAASKTHTVYACGFLDFRTDVHQWWFDASQVFANL
ncbi:MAG TPA: hypothetical protein VGM90_22030 [Kofleriaceae bacterium]|jgi:hypothetical protein